MFIATYNHHVGDVLMIITADKAGGELAFERKRNFARIFRLSDDLSVAWNIFEPSIKLYKDGLQQLTAAEVEQLNAENPFAQKIVFDEIPKLVVAEIVKMEAHPDSDHLQICQVDVGNAELEQIVCGALNAREGLKTIAALPGAMLADGKIIFAGALRGVISNGMLCAARELALPNAPQERGIIELSPDFVTGSSFDAATMWQG